VFYVISTPLWLACSYPPKYSGGYLERNLFSLTLSYIIDLMFLLDMILRYRFYYFEKNGRTILDPELIKLKFKEGLPLKYEILMSVPWDVIAVFIGDEYCALFRCFRVLRLFNVKPLFQNMKINMNGQTSSCKLGMIKLKISTALRRFLKLNIALLLLCHWVGCLFIFVGRVSQFSSDDFGNGNDETGGSWIESDESDERFYLKSYGTSMSWTLYLRAIYWALVGMSTGTIHHHLKIMFVYIHTFITLYYPPYLPHIYVLNFVISFAY
jgi:hypothetical protein